VGLKVAKARRKVLTADPTGVSWVRRRLEVPGPAEFGQGRSWGHPRASPCGRASACRCYVCHPGWHHPHASGSRLLVAINRPEFEDLPKGLAALSTLLVQGRALIVAFSGVVEITGFFSREAKKLGPQKGEAHAGKFRSFRVGFFTFIGTVEGPKVRQKQAEAELANGRLAVKGIIVRFVRTDSRVCLG